MEAGSLSSRRGRCFQIPRLREAGRSWVLERVPRDEGSRDPAFAPRSETIRARMPANVEDPSPMGSPPVRGQGAGASGM